MSSAANIDALGFITQQLNVYVGLFIFITGIFGQICNIIVFTSLKIFRETTCAFYLTMVSIANLGQTLPLLIRVLTGFNVNLSTSGIFCKFRWFLAQYCAVVSLTSMCLTTIDQFLSMTTYRHWNNLGLARRHITFTCVFWFLHAMPTFIYYDSNQYACIIANAVFARYFSYFYLLILLGVLPLTTMIIFSVLAYFRTRTIASRQINHVHLSRDRQLTAMTLVHVLFTVITTIPFVVSNAYTLSVSTNDPQEIARNRLISTVTTLFCFFGFACPFYIYCCVSKRFRKQTVYVLIGIHWNRFQRRLRNMNNNQVLPSGMVSIHNQHGANPMSSNDIELY